MTDIFSYNVFNFRDEADDGSLYTQAIQRAIDYCHKLGGGTIYFPPGNYMTGSIFLKSKVTLYIEAGATIIGSANVDDYPSKFLIYAVDAEDIGIAGPGCIDGQGTQFWEEKELDEAHMWRKGWGEVSHYYQHTKKRPERMIRLSGCSNVRIENVQLRNSSSWTLHLLACDKVTVHGIRIDNPLYGPNTDGIDIDACRNVTVSDCQIRTGDDAIVIKNTNFEGRKQVSRNIVITNCILTTPCNAFKIGTETQADIENIVFSNSVVYSSEDWKLCDRAISGVSIEMVDGARLSQVVVSGITIRNARSPIFIRLGNRGRGQATPVPGTLTDVKLYGIQATGAILPCIISGIRDAEMERVYLSDIQLGFVGGGAEAEIYSDVSELPGDYPEAVMFGRWLPAYGLFCRHVNGLFLRNIDVWLEGDDPRPATKIYKVKDASCLQFAINGKISDALKG